MRIVQEDYLRRRSLSIIGVGAFGEFILKYLIPYFNVSVYDTHRDITNLSKIYNIEICDNEYICDSDIIILAVPVAHIEEAMAAIAHRLQPGQLLIDVASVKLKPVEIITSMIPKGVEYLSIHPLFGPQSGSEGIVGLEVAICDIERSKRKQCVRKFLEDILKLKVHETTPEQHDLEMAYIQGLTHMIAKVFTKMEIPKIHQQTKTYRLLNEMVDMIKYDSAELFLTIQRDNPFVEETKNKFLEAVKTLDQVAS